MRSEALAVAAAAIFRIRRDVETFASRLDRLGYRFGWYDEDTPIPHYEGPITDPTPESLDALRMLEEALGPAPLILHAFYDQIGSIDFCGCHPDWTVEYPDPLVVMPLTVDHVTSLLEECDPEIDERPFRLPIAPDYFHKADVSGGEPYSIELPNRAVDAIVQQEPHRRHFLPYLEHCLQWCGFPGASTSPSGIPASHWGVLRTFGREQT